MPLVGCGAWLGDVDAEGVSVGFGVEVDGGGVCVCVGDVGVEVGCADAVAVSTPRYVVASDGP